MSALDRGNAVEDIRVSDFISVEVKSRKALPKYLIRWVEQANRNCEGKMPVVLIHPDYTQMGEQGVMMSLEDFRELVAELHERREKEK